MPKRSAMADKPHAPHQGLPTTLIGIVASTVLVLIKGIGGILGNSYALIADAIESLTDIFTSIMLYAGLKWSARPADKDHPYGHGKAEALVSVGIALAMVGAAAIICVESIQRIRHPHPIPKAYTLVILVVVIVVKEILFRFVRKKGALIQSDAVTADASHHRSDAITSAAAFIGISIGLIGGPGYEVADDWAALFAAGIIVYNAYRIARPAIGELLDENLNPDLTRRVAQLAAAIPGVIHVEKCYIRKMGMLNHADLHIWVDGSLSVDQGHEISHRVKDAIQEALPSFVDVMIHVEPPEHED